MYRSKFNNSKFISICFVAGLFLILLFCLLCKDEEFSETENRLLSPLPKFYFESLSDGSYTKKFEKYAADTIVFRDFWVKLKNTADFFSLKKDNGYAYFGKDNQLFPIEDNNHNRYIQNIKIVEKFAKDNNIRVSVLIAPTANSVLKEKMPDYAQNYEQDSILDAAKSALGENFIDIRKILKEHKDEYIYYKTDHHWTSLGAYYAYVELAKHLEFKPLEQESLQKRILSENFLGSTEAKIPTFFSPKDEIWAYENSQILDSSARYEDGKPAKMFDESFLKKRDKYSYFTGGNHPLIKISRNIDEREKTGNVKSILIIKDSYANCLAPLLLNHYHTVYLVDLRYYRKNLETLISDIRFADNVEMEDILLLYNVSQFSTDVNLSLLE
ncbi:MAG: DHHW family protein [Eubacteriales bacterium]